MFGVDVNFRGWRCRRRIEVYSGLARFRSRGVGEGMEGPIGVRIIEVCHSDKPDWRKGIFAIDIHSSM
jgi:hypothetical protein